MNKAETEWAPENGSSHWIIVDDNRGILQVVSTILGFMTNARISCFESPEEALKTFELQPDDVPLVITDLEMPGMNGFELCRALQAVRRDVKVLLMTGNHSAIDEASAKLMGFSGLIYKPFLPADVKAVLEQAGVLNAPLPEFERSFAPRT